MFQRATTSASCFGSLEEAFPNRGLLFKERIYSERRRSFLQDSISIEKGQNENGRVASPKSVSSHLDVVTWECHTTYNGARC